MVVYYYEFWFTPVGYNKPKELHIIKHETPYIPDFSEEMSNIVFLTDEVEDRFNKFLENKEDNKVKMLLRKWLFAKKYSLIE